VIAFAFFAVGAYLLVNGLLIASGTVSLASGRYVVGEYSTLGPLLFLVLGPILVALGFGLLKGWGFTRRLAVVAAALLLATAVVPISAAFSYFQIFGIVIHGAKIILAVMAIQYLLRPEVRDFFSGRNAQ
jgi:hypothetical protein